MSKVIMAIGAHIGDMELSAGGVLATHALNGDQIITVALTSGEKGNPPHLPVEKYRIQKHAEAKAFADELGGISVVLPYNDGELPVDDKVKFEVAALIRKYKPNVILTHWKNSIHKDHANTFLIVADAQFYAGLAGFEMEEPAHWANGPYYCENWEDATDFKCYTFVEVSEAGFELWQRAIDHHWFALNSTSFKYKDYYTHLMSVRGREARMQYAQAFNINEEYKRQIVKSF
ncbi:MAG: PIG-L deacetylase family protein [Turicibacter sp.]